MIETFALKMIQQPRFVFGQENWHWRHSLLSKSGWPGSRLFLGAVLAVIAVTSGGCGDGDSGPAPRRLVQQPPQIDQTTAPAKKSPPAAARPSPETPWASGGMGATGRDQPKPAVKRDTDVSKWKMPDYYSAKKENDPRLLQAMQYIAENEKFVGNEKIALVLINLLTAEEPKEDPKEEPKKDSAVKRFSDGPEMGGPEMGMGGYGARFQLPRLDRQTIEAVIIALAANGSKPAKKALRDVVLGTLKTDDDFAATKAALAEVVTDKSPENEAVLFRALTEPEKLRPEEKAASTRSSYMAPESMGRGYGASGKLSADALRQMTLNMAEPTASEALRTKLASHLLKPDMLSATINVLSAMLLKPHPNNVGPQLLLFESSEPDLMTKAQLAEFFTEYSETALGYLLGVLKHTEPFKFSEQSRDTKPGSEQSQAAWGKSAAKTGWGNLSAGGEQPRGMDPGMGPDFMGYKGMGGNANRSEKTLDTKQFMAADSQMPARIAKKLWSTKVVRLVGDQLAQASSPAEASMVIPLARTMPVDNVRARLHQLMQKHWENGSQPFLSDVTVPTGGGMGLDGMGLGGMGLEPGYGKRRFGDMGMPRGRFGGQFDKPICDPGFLVLVKMLPTNQKQNGGRRPRGGRENGTGSASYGPGMDMPGMGMPGTGGRSPIADWQSVHENLLYQFAAAFQAAARLGRDAPTVGTLPLDLHSDAGIDTRFDLKWPESGSKESALKLDPIEIHYVKISETADPSKVLKSYSRSLKTKHRMLQPNRVALLDTIKGGSVPGRKLSIDVLITRQRPGMAAAQPTDRKSKKKTGEPLTVEILTIEIKDPNPAATPTKTENGAQDKEAKKAARLKALRKKAAASKLKR